MKNYRYHSLVCLVLVSCSSSTKKEDPKAAKECTELIRNEMVFVVDIDNTPKEKALYLSDYFKNVQSIALEDVENGLIGKISKLIVLNESIFILDSSIAHCLFVFNREGKFIRKIGRIGKGPGEYSNLSDFTIDLDHNIIYVLDSHIQKINHYCPTKVGIVF